MKPIHLLVFSLLAIVSLRVQAGSDEQQSLGDFCYQLDLPQSSARPEVIPHEICVQSVQVTLGPQPSIEVRSTIQPGYFQDPMEVSFIYSDSNPVTFVASKPFYQSEDTTCGNGETVTLIMIGDLSDDGSVNPSELKIQATHQVTNDTCHSEGQSTDYSYKL